MPVWGWSSFSASLLINSVPMRRSHLALIVVATTSAGCERAPAKAIPEIPHAGFRTDIPDSLRGNATFESAVYARDGRWLVTVHLLSPGLRVWDGQSGALVSHVEAAIDPNEPWMVDASTARLVAHRSGERALSVFDLKSGAVIGDVGDTTAAPPTALGVANGKLVTARDGAVDVWSLDSLVRVAHVALPLMGAGPGCTGGIPSTTNDKKCWELSASGRWLAMALTPRDAADAASQFVLVDLAEQTWEALALPDGALDQHLASFAFSADETHLAMGTDRGLYLRDIAARSWTAHVNGPARRNRFLGPIAFTARDTRLFALGDLLGFFAHDAASGAQAGFSEIPFWDREGILKASADGSRVMVYRFVADVIEIFDGANAQHVGWICPFFCNAKHNPVAVAFAVSPDGMTVAASHRYGAGLFDAKTDRLIAPLRDPTLPAVAAR